MVLMLLDSLLRNSSRICFENHRNFTYSNYKVASPCGLQCWPKNLWRCSFITFFTPNASHKHSANFHVNLIWYEPKIGFILVEYAKATKAQKCTTPQSRRKHQRSGLLTHYILDIKLEDQRLLISESGGDQSILIKVGLKGKLIGCSGVLGKPVKKVGNQFKISNGQPTTEAAGPSGTGRGPEGEERAPLILSLTFQLSGDGPWVDRGWSNQQPTQQPLE